MNSYKWEMLVRCPEWDTLVQDYIAVVKLYREAVSGMVELKGSDFNARHGSVERLRMSAELGAAGL